MDFDRNAYYKQRVGDKIKTVFNNFEEIKELIKRINGDKTLTDETFRKLFISLGELWGDVQNIGIKKGKDGKPKSTAKPSN